MFKKILLYGVAFGSVAGAFMFIHLNNYGADQSLFQKGFYTLLQFLLIPFTCVFLLVRAVRREYQTMDGQSAKPGNYIMAGLFTSVVMGLTISAIYAYINSQFHGLIENAIRFDTVMLDSKREVLEEALKSKNDNRTFEELKATYLEQYQVGRQFSTNLFQYTSVGLLVSGIMALFYFSKDKKKQ
jgi:hypothetical protein